MLARIANSQYVTPKGFLYHLSQLGFYGEDIWYGFETFCRSDLEYFKACVEIEDKNFYNAVMDWKAKQALKAMNGESGV